MSTAAEKKPEVHDAPKDGLRETIESIVIAFVLAFLFRTFEAEAFVIPTGSMAPTLMGRHYDTACPKCGFTVKIGASEENIDDDPNMNPWQKQQFLEQRQLRTHTCPNCRYEANYSADGREAGTLPTSYSGDRIIVSKFPYEIGSPQRWDVAVFRYPATPKTNYIKRIVGLPGETLRIHNGDIYTRATGEAEFKIERKPAHKVTTMLQTVYDNDFVLAEEIGKGWPARWQNDFPAGEGTWKPSDDWKSYTISGRHTGEAWLRYRHFAPSRDEWNTLNAGPLSEVQRQKILPQLISDMYAYNSRSPASSGGYDLDVLGMHWVGDLAVECEFIAEDKQGEMTLELVEAGRRHRCRFDLATGEATLTIDSLPEFQAKAQTKVRGPCKVQLRLANIDDQLHLWVNDSLVKFDRPTTFGPIQVSKVQEADWSPVAIGIKGAAARVGHLRVLRDIYYVSDKPRNVMGPVNDYDDIPPYRDDYLPLFMMNGRIPFQRQVEFKLDTDQFMALGDNSPKSKDSRLWTGIDARGGVEHYVHRDLLLGKAMFIYWPHAWAPDWAPNVKLGRFSFKVPFYPNFSRMQFIR
jgi:signal peptidase I